MSITQDISTNHARYNSSFTSSSYPFLSNASINGRVKSVIQLMSWLMLSHMIALLLSGLIKYHGKSESCSDTNGSNCSSSWSFSRYRSSSSERPNYSLSFYYISSILLFMDSHMLTIKRTFFQRYVMRSFFSIGVISLKVLGIPSFLPRSRSNKEGLRNGYM